MGTMAIGFVERGSFSDGDLLINGASVGSLEVMPNDEDEALTAAFNGVTGITATLDAGVITINWDGILEVTGRDPTGGGILNDLMEGFYQ